MNVIKKIETFLGIISLILFYVGLPLLVSETIKYFKLSKDSIGLIFFGYLILIGAFFGFCYYIFEKIGKYIERYETCKHGIKGGKTRLLCTACEDEKRAAEEKYRKQIELEEQKRRIQSSANELRNAELIRLTKTVLPSLDELRELSPSKFEDEIAAMFKRLGYNVKQTPYSSDAGRDAILWKEGEKYVLECKKYSSERQSGRPELQKFHSALISENARKGFFVTTGNFSRDAVKFAKSAQIELINGNKLIKYLIDSKPGISDDDRYYSKCLQCGELVQHHLRTPNTVQCRNNHPVEPTLILEKIFGIGPDTEQICPKCSSPMRLIKGRNGKFWGCTRYPACRSTRSWKP